MRMRPQRGAGGQYAAGNCERLWFPIAETERAQVRDLQSLGNARPSSGGPVDELVGDLDQLELVGSALVDHLRAEDYENVLPLKRADCDLLDAPATFAFLARSRPDHVFHAAARVYGLGGSMKHQGASFYENCVINANVIEGSRRAGARKITVMGTGAVYPFPSPGLPLKEDMIFLGRPHPAHAGYANAKRAMLAMLEAYEESYGLK